MKRGVGTARSVQVFRSHTRAAAAALGVAALCVLCGCLSDPSGNVGFDEPDPQARLRAVRAAAEADDAGAIKSLIEMLDSDDPAERFFAIGTLADLADGERFGYRHWEDRSERRGAIARWVEWETNRSANVSQSIAQPASKGAALVTESSESRSGAGGDGKGAEGAEGAHVGEGGEERLDGSSGDGSPVAVH